MATTAAVLVAPSKRAALTHANIWRAPLVLPALAWTAGIVIDRHVELAPAVSLMVGAACLVAWRLLRPGMQPVVPLLCLLGAMTAAGAARHHLYCHIVAADNIGHFAPDEPQPALVRGVVHTAPVIPKKPPDDPLRGFGGGDRTKLVLRATSLKTAQEWRPVSGLVQVTIAGQEKGVHLHDEVEVAGRLSAPPEPANPGEFDYGAFLRDQGVHAVLTARSAPETIRVLTGQPAFLRNAISIGGWLAELRAWCQEVLDRTIRADEAGVARALLLGDSSAMTAREWDKYQHTGVIHVLAISGQHLVIVGLVAWGCLNLIGVRRRRGALLVACFLMGYALLVGARPPVMRPAWSVLVLCGGLILCRPPVAANSFAAAWILVTILNPADAFNAGCLLSFLAAAVLFWGPHERPGTVLSRYGVWLTGGTRSPDDPLDRLVDESRPLWLQRARRLAGSILMAYWINATVWLAVTPLVASRFQLISPIALLIGPPVAILSSLALVGGFLLLLAGALFFPLAHIFAWITTWSLWACEALVDFGLRVPGAYWFVPDIPAWWLWGFYVWLLAWLTLDALRRWRFSLLVGVGWLCLGLLAAIVPAPGKEFRCTFLAVGHGGCTVIETPDGRTLLYDAGAITGPEVTLRQIAPYLWQRGIRRIDELFLSHADLDHFNGIPALLTRFALGQATCTPTFSARETEAVHLTLEAFRRHGIPLRIIRAGDQLAAGNVQMRVLHPPSQGPDGNENARSMVLLVEYEGHKILLTGDLEGPGLERVLSMPPLPVDVLMAPHHGSRTANVPELARWARPKVVVSCQGKPRGSPEGRDPYTSLGARLLCTWPAGAVTVRSSREGLVVETFRSKERLLIRKHD
jgi:competence protein ComEC